MFCESTVEKDYGEGSITTSSSTLTLDSSAEIIDGWIDTVEKGEKVKGITFDPQIVEIIQHKEEKEELFRSIYNQLVDKLTKIKKKASGGYFISYNQKKKTIFFDPCGGSKAK
jgi:hypothetical protein